MSTNNQFNLPNDLYVRILAEGIPDSVLSSILNYPGSLGYYRIITSAMPELNSVLRYLEHHLKILKVKQKREEPDNVFGIPNNVYRQLINAGFEKDSIANLINYPGELTVLINSGKANVKQEQVLITLKKFISERNARPMLHNPNNKLDIPNDLYSKLLLVGVNAETISDVVSDIDTLTAAVGNQECSANARHVLLELKTHLEKQRRNNMETNKCNNRFNLPNNLYDGLIDAGLFNTDIENILACRAFIDMFLLARPNNQKLRGKLQDLVSFLDKTQSPSELCDTRITRGLTSPQEDDLYVEEFTAMVGKIRDKGVSHRVLYDFYSNRMSISNPFYAAEFLLSLSGMPKFEVINCVAHSFNHLDKERMLQIIDNVYGITNNKYNRLNLPSNLYDKLIAVRIPEDKILKLMTESKQDITNSMDALLQETKGMPKVNTVLRELKAYLATNPSPTCNNKFNLPNKLYDKLINAKIPEGTIPILVNEHNKNRTSALDSLLQASISLPEVNEALKELQIYLASTTSAQEPVDEAPQAVTEDEALLKCLSAFIDTGIGYETVVALANTDLNLKDANLSGGSPIRLCNWKYAKEADLSELYTSLLTENDNHNEIIKKMCQTGYLPFNLTIYDIVRDTNKLKVIEGIIHYDKTHSENYTKLSKVVHLYGIHAIRVYLNGSVAVSSNTEPKLSKRFATTSTPPNKTTELTANQYYKVYKDKGENLHGVDKELSEEEVEKIVKTKGLNALKHIPNELFTEEFCKEFVSLDGGTLLFVPENMRTLELCNLALDTNYIAYRYVPKSVQSDELLLKSQRRKADVIIKQAFVSSEACSSPEYAEARNLRLRLDSADVSEYEFILDQIEELASVWN